MTDNRKKIDTLDINRIRDEALCFANVGLYRYRLDGKIVFMDQATLKLLDLETMKPEDVIGRDISSLFNHEKPPGYLRNATRAQKQARNIEYRYRTLSGKERWVYHNAYLVRDPDFGDDLVQVVSQDITALKQATTALETSERRFRTLAEQIRQGIAIIIPASSRIVFINPFFREILGIADAEALTTTDGSLWAYVHPEDMATLESTRKQWIEASGSTASCEIRIVRPDNTTRWTIFSGTSTEFDGLAAMLITLVDITERKAAEEKQRKFEADMHHTQKLESLGILAGGIAHDFNNILTAITGSCDLGRIRLADDSVACEYLVGIRHAAERAAELCQSLLAYAGRHQIESKPVNIDELVNETLPLLKLSMSRKADLIYRTDNERLSVTGDRSQLRQVLLNLILNASESLNGHTGSIQIGVQEKQLDSDALIRFYNDQPIAAGRYVLLEVSDTGTGMEPDTLARLFEPFYTTKFTGRGLGLAAVLGIIRGHGGGIQVFSTPGQGSCFSIYLPAARDNDAIKETFGEEPVVGWGEGLVLIAEDNPQVQAVTRAMVEAIGFNALCASDGRQAVELFEKNADILRAAILDVAMPVMDGLEVFLNIRSRRETLPVLFVSGFDTANVQKELKKETNVAFLQKPFFMKAFSACLKGLVTG